jgi:hypothetical protein
MSNIKIYNIDEQQSTIKGEFSKDNPYLQKASAWENKKRELMQARGNSRGSPNRII